MRVIGYAAIFMGVWIPLLLISSDWTYRSTSNCLSERWPQQWEYKPIKSLQMPAMREVNEYAQNVFSVAPTMPLFCADLEKHRLRAWEVVHRFRAVGEHLPRSDIFQLTERWRQAPRKDDVLLFYDPSKPWFVQRFRMGIESQSKFALLLPLYQAKELYILHLRRFKVEDVNLIPRNERFFGYQTAHDRQGWSYSLPYRRWKRFCYRIPKGKHLKKGLYYSVEESFSSSYRHLFLRMSASVGEAKTTSALAAPSLRAVAFRHEGSCSAHGAVALLPKDRVLRRWYRWSVVRSRDKALIEPFAKPWFLPEVVLDRNLPSHRIVLKGKRRFSRNTGANIGFPPVFSSLWDKGILGQRLDVEVRAIDPRTGAMSPPQRLKVLVTSTLPRNTAKRNKALNKLFASHLKPAHFKLLAFFQGLLLFGFLWNLWQQRRDRKAADLLK